MKFGVRECCDVVLRAKGTQKVGNKIFYKNEPVCYFDTLKTSSLEGAATTVYAQGGRGNARLMSWDGERTVTWTMEDALISPVGMMILTGAGLIESSEATPIYVHTTEQLQLCGRQICGFARRMERTRNTVQSDSGCASCAFAGISHLQIGLGNRPDQPKNGRCSVHRNRLRYRKYPVRNGYSFCMAVDFAC